MEWLLSLLGGGDKPGAESKNMAKAGTASMGSSILDLLGQNQGTPAPGQQSLVNSQNQLNSLLAMMNGLGGF